MTSAATTATAKGTTDDRLAIRELLDRYADGVNQRDVEIWGSTWAEDSEWNLPVVPGFEEVKGKANIVEAWLGSMKLFPFVHMMCSVGPLRFEGDRCHFRYYTAEVAVMADGTEIRPRGQYDDIAVKQNGEWLFEKRSFNPLHGE